MLPYFKCFHTYLPVLTKLYFYSCKYQKSTCVEHYKKRLSFCCLNSTCLLLDLLLFLLPSEVAVTPYLAGLNAERFITGKTFKYHNTHMTQTDSSWSDDFKLSSTRFVIILFSQVLSKSHLVVQCLFLCMHGRLWFRKALLLNKIQS